MDTRRLKEKSVVSVLAHPTLFIPRSSQSFSSIFLRLFSSTSISSGTVQGKGLQSQEKNWYYQSSVSFIDSIPDVQEGLINFLSLVPRMMNIKHEFLGCFIIDNFFLTFSIFLFLIRRSEYFKSFEIVTQEGAQCDVFCPSFQPLYPVTCDTNVSG